MKKRLKNFIKERKKLLLSLIIILCLFILNIFILFLVIASKQEAVNEFLTTSKLTSEIIPISILSFAGMGLGIVFLILVAILVLKIMIPNKKTLDNIMMKDELDFLINIPKEIGKEVKKNGK